MIGSNSEDGNESEVAFRNQSEELQTPESLLSIGKVAEKYQVTLRTLRFYEHSGLLNPIRRGSTRLYSVTDCRRLELILKGRQLGFSLGEIHKLVFTQEDNLEVNSIESILTPARILAQIDDLERRRGQLDKSIADLEIILQKLSEREK